MKSPGMAATIGLLTGALVACTPSEPGTFAGAVMTADGTPQAGCSITATPGSDVDQPVPEYAAVSDGQGRYEYRLPAGTYEIGASCEASAGSSTAHAAAGKTTALDLVTSSSHAQVRRRWPVSRTGDGADIGRGGASQLAHFLSA